MNKPQHKEGSPAQHHQPTATVEKAIPPSICHKN